MALINRCANRWNTNRSFNDTDDDINIYHTFSDVVELIKPNHLLPFSTLHNYSSFGHSAFLHKMRSLDLQTSDKNCEDLRRERKTFTWINLHPIFLLDCHFEEERVQSKRPFKSIVTSHWLMNIFEKKNVEWCKLHIHAF